MTQILFVGLGGCLGAACRFLVSSAVQRLLPAAVLPWGTLAVNVFGCALIGLFAAMAEARFVLTDSTRLFLFTGLLGGFTTFSAFSLEALRLARGDTPLFSLAHVVLHVLLCLGAVLIGDALGRQLVR